MKKFDLHLDKYGVSLSVRDGQFYIRSKDHRQSVPINKVREITLSKSTSITGSAIKLALDQDIDISFVERDMMPFARIWNSKFGSITTIRRNQLAFTTTGEATIWIKEVISTKIKNQMALVSNVSGDNDGPYVRQFRDKLSGYLLKINEVSNPDALVIANQLRGWEANASKMFFRCLSQSLPLEWRFSKRTKRPALDPFNAVLNYAYGILYNKIEGMIIRAGLDPHIGIFHKDQHNRPVLVYDIIELFRHWAEYPVIQCFQHQLLSKDHFIQLHPGYIIVSPGKKIIIELIMSYYNEKVEYNKNRSKRLLHIQSYIQDFAQRMKNLKKSDVKQSGI